MPQERKSSFYLSALSLTRNFDSPKKRKSWRKRWPDGRHIMQNNVLFTYYKSITERSIVRYGRRIPHSISLFLWRKTDNLLNFILYVLYLEQACVISDTYGCPESAALSSLNKLLLFLWNVRIIVDNYKFIWLHFCFPPF